MVTFVRERPEKILIMVVAEVISMTSKKYVIQTVDQEVLGKVDTNEEKNRHVHVILEPKSGYKQKRKSGVYQKSFERCLSAYYQP